LQVVLATHLSRGVCDLAHALAVIAEGWEKRQVVVRRLTAVVYNATVDLIDFLACPKVEPRDKPDAKVSQGREVFVGKPNQGVATEEHAPTDTATIAGFVATKVAEVPASSQVNRPFQHVCSHLTAILPTSCCQSKERRLAVR
jgi:hypothetical protein